MENRDSLINVINVADNSWESSIMGCLSAGNLIFAYKNTEADMFLDDLENKISEYNETKIEPDPEQLYQVIVKKNYENKAYGKQKYSVTIVTSKKAYTLNMLPATYLTCELIEVLREFKISEKIIANFEQIIKDIEE